MSSLFQHRQYVKIAQIITGLDETLGLTRAEIAARFAKELQGTNPGFSQERFFQAATGNPRNGRDK